MKPAKRSSTGWVLTTALTLAASACATGAPAGGDAPDLPAVVTLEAGRLSSEAEAEAATLLGRARDALDALRLADARSAAARVVETFPASRVSVDALLVLARAEAREGDVDAAMLHAERLSRVLPPDDRRRTDVATIRATALRAAGRPEDAVRALLALPPELAPRGGDADALVREVSNGLDREALGAILRDTPLGNPLSIPVMLAYAGRLRLSGDAEGARRLASAALDAGAGEADERVARAILEGRALPGEAPARVAVVLPLTSSPALQALAAGVRDGIEAAVAGSPLADGIDVEYLDDRGDPATAAELVREAAAGGASGFIGPLQDVALDAAVGARSDPIPILSPTAYELPPDAPAVYSLASVDPGAPRALADWASSVGLSQVVILHPSRGPSAEEARLFSEAFQASGGSVLRSLTYEPGTAFFQDQMRAIQGLKPEALVLPVPPDDVQAIASQAAYFALDTLGIQLLGTAAWGSPAVRQDVSTRYTDGVVTATPRVSGDTEGYRAFVAAYEARFQRTLTEPASPAAGFDAASLVLRALESGARTPGAVVGALEEIDGFEGATGVLSIEDGRLVRRHDVVCIQNAGLVPLPPGVRPEPVYRAYPPDPETGIVPEGPGRPAGFRCGGRPVDEIR